MRANYPFPCGNSSAAGSEAKAAAVTCFSLKRRYLGMLLSFGSPKNSTEMAEPDSQGACILDSVLPLIIGDQCAVLLALQPRRVAEFFLTNGNSEISTSLSIVIIFS